MRRTLVYLLYFFLVTNYAMAATYTVSQDGSGRDYSVSTFNAETRTGEHTYMFYGTITSQVLFQVSGTSESAMTTLDGTNATFTAAVTNGALRTTGADFFILKNISVDMGYWEYPDQDTTSRIAIDIYPGSGNECDTFRIEGADITHSGMGIYIGGLAHDFEISGSYIHEMNNHGVWISAASGVKPYNGKIESNEFYNVGFLDSSSEVSPAIELIGTNNIIVRRNHVHNDMASMGMLALYANFVQSILVEYNRFDTFNGQHHRSAISFKNDAWPCTYNEDIVIRWNRIANSYGDDQSWGSSSAGINIGYNWRDVFIYGNEIYRCGVGIDLAISWDTNPDNGCGAVIYNDGYDVGPGYVFSNIISTTQGRGVYTGYGTTNASYDAANNIYLYNNTFYRCGTGDCTLGYGYASCPYDSSATFGSVLSDAQMDLHRYTNNLVYESRPNDTDYIQWQSYIDTTSGSTLYDYNHYYDPDTTSLLIRLYESDWTNYDWDDTGRPDYGGNATQGNPYFNSAGTDFRLTSSSPSSVVSGGLDMGTGNLFSDTIAGESITVPWDFALGPDTVWSDDPDSISIDDRYWDTIGSWGKGAYAFTDSGGSGANNEINTTVGATVNGTENAIVN
jgi:hypothetical protein